MIRLGRGPPSNDTRAQEIASDTLTSARALLGSLGQELAASSSERLVEIFERVERAYDEFPELELEYPRSVLVRRLVPSAAALDAQRAVPLLMFCTALDTSSGWPVSALLERMALFGHDQAIAGIVRVLARNRDFTSDEIIPAIEQLQRHGRLEAALALISEVLGRIDLPPDQSAHEFDSILKRLLLDDDYQDEADPSGLAAIAWSARNRLRQPTLLRAESGHGETLLSLAERVSAKLSSPPLPPPPPELPQRLGWRSGRLGFKDFVAQWSGAPGVQVDWLPMMRVGDAGERVAGVLRARLGQEGHIVYGPYFRLPPGEYRVRARMDIGRSWRWRYHHEPVAKLEAVADGGHTYLVQQDITPEDSSRREHEVSFVVTEAAASADHNIVELRIWTNGTVPLCLSSITVERLTRT